MDWCVKEKFEEANHKPIIQIQGEVDRNVKAGETVVLDARGTLDPDGNKMRFEWWQYQEAGSCDQMVKVDHAQGKKVSFVAPIVNQECTIHIVLEVSDSGSPALFSFQRMIITVEP